MRTLLLQPYLSGLFWCLQSSCCVVISIVYSSLFSTPWSQEILRCSVCYCYDLFTSSRLACCFLQKRIEMSCIHRSTYERDITGMILILFIAFTSESAQILIYPLLIIHFKLQCTTSHCFSVSLFPTEWYSPPIHLQFCWLYESFVKFICCISIMASAIHSLALEFHEWKNEIIDCINESYLRHNYTSSRVMLLSLNYSMIN